MIIKLNYDLAIQQAKKIEEAAKSCEDQVTMVKNSRTRISEAWSGASASALLEQLSDWCEEMQKLVNEQRNIAAGLRKKADEIKAIDEKESKKE